MYEYEYFDGCDWVTFDIVETNLDRNAITLAITYLGKISVITYELLEDENGLYFEYGSLFTKIYIEDFTEEN